MIKSNKILIAEDEAISYRLLEVLIRKIGIDCNILHAKNGQEAVDFIKKNPDIVLVLMDIKMPLMDGVEASKIIRKISPDTEIIAQTAFTKSIEVERIKQAGINVILHKPIKRNELSAVFKEYLVN